MVAGSQDPNAAKAQGPKVRRGWPPEYPTCRTYNPKVAQASKEVTMFSPKAKYMARAFVYGFLCGAFVVIVLVFS